MEQEAGGERYRRYDEIWVSESLEETLIAAGSNTVQLEAIDVARLAQCACCHHRIFEIHFHRFAGHNVCMHCFERARTQSPIFDLVINLHINLWDTVTQAIHWREERIILDGLQIPDRVTGRNIYELLGPLTRDIVVRRANELGINNYRLTGPYTHGVDEVLIRAGQGGDIENPNDALFQIRNAEIQMPENIDPLLERALPPPPIIRFDETNANNPILPGWDIIEVIFREEMNAFYYVIRLPNNTIRLVFDERYANAHRVILQQETLRQHLAVDPPAQVHVEQVPVNGIVDFPAQLVENNEIDEVDIPKFQCAFCDEEFLFVENLATHVRMQHPNPGFRCPICLVSFTRNDNLLRHVKVVHHLQ